MPTAVTDPDTRDRYKVLIVDDDEAIRTGLSRVLGRAGFDIAVAADGAAGLARLVGGDFDAALVDLHAPELSGELLLSRARGAGVATEVVLMAAFADVDATASALELGAFELLRKPFVSNEAVTIAVRNAARRRRLTQRAAHLEKALEERRATPTLIGQAPKVVAMMKRVSGVAASDSTVLVLGESGTGKELVARALHERSRRAGRPLVTLNCAAIPGEIVESELFGHVRGAFTGAHTARAGLFETANGGTIFLDEVGDLPIGVQVKLLRALQLGEIRRVGADTSTNVDVRVIAATNANLKAAIERGTFRQDFYYRLNVISIVVPPLRDRREDILLLASHFVDRYALRSGKGPMRLHPAAARALEGHDWPGNVRELEHAVEHAVVLATTDEITADLLPFVGGRSIAPPPAPSEPSRAFGHPPPASISVSDLLALPYAAAKARAIARFNAAYLDDLLVKTGSNLSEAARRSGLDRSNFRRLVKSSTVTERNGDRARGD